MVGATPALRDEFPNIVVDAKVGRQMTSLDDRISALKGSGRLGRTVIVALGTNGPFSSRYLDRQIRSLGDRRILLVNTSVPRSWESDVNRTLAAAAKRFPKVDLVDWQATVDDQPSILSGDDIHLSGSRGGRVYANTIAKALS